jgi:hypothetical protein
MQPILSIMAPIGLGLMYFVQKYALFYRCSRPRPSSDLVIQSMDYVVYITVIAYALGSLTWTNFLPDSHPKGALMPNLISLGIGILLLIIPLNEIIDAFSYKYLASLSYEN